MIPDSVVRFSYPTIIIFGPGATRQLPQALAEADVRKPLLVTDSGLVKTDAYAAVVAALKDGKVAHAVYAGVHPNPIEADVNEAAEAYRREGCDGVIGLGGGSALDVAKLVPVRVTHEGPLARYEAQHGGWEHIHGPLPPVVALPTTAGTGSEIGRSSVVTSPEEHRKIIVFSPLMMPKRVVADPVLTVGLPPKLTAATGMDALTHCIEALVCPAFHPMSDAMAAGGIELIAQYLERAVRDGKDLEARGYMMIAAMMGALAFQKDLGATHALAHPLSTEFDLHHGLANAICLLPVMRYNKQVAAAKYAIVARCFGVNTFNLSESDAADAAIAAVGRLCRAVGIPRNLAEVGVKESDLAQLAPKAFKDSCHLTNPRPCREADLLNLYREALAQ
ncbi:iron-containing alcohol dehydrogenase [bacterium]|nr:iron-containing alcohol dehydrogenase [bacterium]